MAGRCLLFEDGGIRALIGVGGLFLLFFPTLGGRPNTTKEKVIVFAVFAVGIVAGLVNWFLMDPGYFGF